MSPRGPYRRAAPRRPYGPGPYGPGRARVPYLTVARQRALTSLRGEGPLPVARCGDPRHVTLHEQGAGAVARHPILCISALFVALLLQRGAIPKVTGNVRHGAQIGHQWRSAHLAQEGDDVQKKTFALAGLAVAAAGGVLLSGSPAQAGALVQGHRHHHHYSSHRNYNRNANWNRNRHRVVVRVNVRQPQRQHRVRRARARARRRLRAVPAPRLRIRLR